MQAPSENRAREFALMTELEARGEREREGEDARGRKHRESQSWNADERGRERETALHGGRARGLQIEAFIYLSENNVGETCCVVGFLAC